MSNRKPTDRWKILGRKRETVDTMVWCLHCGRWYRLGDHRVVGKKKMQLCAYEGCSGDTVLDAKTKRMWGEPEDWETEE